MIFLKQCAFKFDVFQAEIGPKSLVSLAGQKDFASLFIHGNKLSEIETQNSSCRILIF